MPRYDAKATRYTDRVMSVWARANLPETLSVRASADATEIMIYDEIGFFGISAADFMGALANAGDGPVRVRVNSPGGDVFDGLAIYNAIKARGNVEVVVDGLAASAASFIAMAGSPVLMAQNSFMMIHNAGGFVIGNANDMEQFAGTLRKIDGQLASIYSARTGKPSGDIAAAMDAETWFTANEAMAYGLIDKTYDGAESKPVAQPAVTATLVDIRAIARPGRVVAAADWAVGAARDLPIDDNSAWDGPAAAERILDDAGFNGDNPDPAKAARGFLIHDVANPKLKGSYKLPFADVKGGTLTAYASGIRAAASRLPQTDAPQDVLDKARNVIDAYEARMKPDNSNVSEIINAGRSLSAANEAKLKAAHDSIGEVLSSVAEPASASSRRPIKADVDGRAEAGRFPRRSAAEVEVLKLRA